MSKSVFSMTKTVQEAWPVRSDTVRIIEIKTKKAYLDVKNKMWKKMKLGEARLHSVKHHLRDEKWSSTESTLQRAMTLNNKTHHGRKKKRNPAHSWGIHDFVNGKDEDHVLTKRFVQENIWTKLLTEENLLIQNNSSCK